MTKAIKAFSFAAMVFILVANIACFAEHIRFTTIMPKQNILRKKDGAIGMTYKELTDTDVEDGDLIVEGNVGIGTMNPNSQLEVAGVIHSQTGGIKFPDDSIQTRAAIFSGARVFVSSTGSVSVPSSFAPTTAIPFDSERYDTDDYHSTSTNPTRVTIPIAGKYLLTANLTFGETSGVGSRGLWIRLNNTPNMLASNCLPATSMNTSLSLTTVYDFEAGDYIEMMAGQDSGTTMNTGYEGTTGQLHLTITRLDE